MQQESSSTAWNLYWLIGTIATSIGLAAGSLLTWFVKRRKVEPEIDAIHATSEKTRAEARRLDAETIAQAYDRIDELWSVCESQRLKIGELSMSNDKRAIEMEMLDYEVQWMSAVLKAANVKLSDYDHLRRKKGE